MILILRCLVGRPYPTKDSKIKIILTFFYFHYKG